MNPIQPVERSFTCEKCAKTFKTTQTTVRTWPIDKWWNMVGHQCANCRVEAQGEPPQDTELNNTTPVSLIPKQRFSGDDETDVIEAQFAEFHRKNPQVYRALVREGRMLLARGHRKLGIGMLYERLRWQVYMSTHDDQVNFKLPNNYRSRYARLIMQQESEFEGVFNLAELRSQRRGGPSVA